MRAIARLLLAASMILIGATLCRAGETPKLVLVLKTAGAAEEAASAFEARYGKGIARIRVVGEKNAASELEDARVVFLEHPEAELLRRISASSERVRKKKLVLLTDVPEVLNRNWGTLPDAAYNGKALTYFQLGGIDNLVGFLAVMYQASGARPAVTLPPVVDRPLTGVYHPRADHYFRNLKEYLAWYRRTMPGQGKLALVTFFQTSIRDHELRVVDALIAGLEAQGLAAAAVFGWPYSTLSQVVEAPPDDPITVHLTFVLALSRPDDAAAMAKDGVHVISLATANTSYDEWAKSARGVAPERVGSTLAGPERTGATEPITVATQEADAATGIYHYMPIAERIQMAARRARRWVALQEKNNFEKKLTILYYNNPPGKGNIGASYLNLPPSIVAVLRKLHDAGYNTGDRIPTAEELLAQLEHVGRNIELWAPGELERMVQSGGVMLIPMERYRQWFSELPQQFRDSVNARWGSPEAAKLMMLTSREGKKFFVIPGVRLGNIFLGPQILRAATEDIVGAQHSPTLPPHHAYIASYLYYRRQFGADAVIHMGRHGTLEWLPGKNAGQAGWDSSEVLLGDLPNLYYYIMDGGGEELQARRRSAAVDISHLTPMIAAGGSQARFAALSKAIGQWNETHETSPELAAQYRRKAMSEIRRLKLDTQLKLPDSEDATMKAVDAFLDAAEDAPIPLGLPVLGEAPSADRQRAGLGKLVRSGFTAEELKRVEPWVDNWCEAVFTGQSPELSAATPDELRPKISKLLDEATVWIRDLQASPERELNAMIDVLRGRFLASGLSGDPLNTPAALPAGRNLHEFDPATFPTKEAWAVGQKMGHELIDRFRQAHGGTWPQRVSMVLWSGETGRHHGAMEAEALYLMGVEPEWNARGAVDRVRLVPDSRMDHPRVSVLFTASALYRDSMADKMLLLDRAARMAAAAGDNALSRQNREVEKQLVERGVPETEAAHLAAARVFSEAPGSYGNGLSQAVEVNGEKSQAKAMAEQYLARTNYVYTGQVWGTSTPKLLAAQLSGNEAIVHSRSSNLYGLTDNDDVYQYVGGLDLASRSVGASPDVLFNNLRQPGKARVEDAKQMLATELHSRNWNPKWIEAMKSAGYAGAREMANHVENLYGWQATSPENVDPSVWKKTFDVYVTDEYGLKLREFFSKASPMAQQKLVARLIDVHRQGIYRFSKQEEATLLRTFVQSVSRMGVACSAAVCGNRRLRNYVLERGRAMPAAALSKEELQAFRRQFAQATHSNAAVMPQPRLTRAGGKPSKPDATWLKKILLIDLHASPREFIERPFGIEWSVWLISWVIGGLYAALQRRRRLWSFNGSIIGLREEGRR